MVEEEGIEAMGSEHLGILKEIVDHTASSFQAERSGKTAKEREDNLVEEMKEA